MTLFSTKTLVSFYLLFRKGRVRSSKHEFRVHTCTRVCVRRKVCVKRLTLHPVGER